MALANSGRRKSRLAAAVICMALVFGSEAKPSESPSAPAKSGCPSSESTDTAGNAAKQPANAEAIQPGLTSALVLWAKGDKEGAVAALLATDWTKPVSPDSILAMTETQYTALSAAKRKNLEADMTRQLTDVRALYRYVLESARKIASANPAEAKSMLLEIRNCGAYLSRPTGLAIGRLVGQAIEKGASQELRRLDAKPAQSK